jgi:iron complex outermembrane receptor protein
MKITLLRSLLVIGAFICFGFVQAQEVTGTVSDAQGPLPGASVVVKGTTTGTQTDFDGNYTIEAGSDATLVFSYVGFKTQEIAVNSQSSINVTMQEDAEALEEVVVIGYGTTTVKDATGSVTAVKAEDFNAGIISSPEQLIQGKTAGVQISQSSGEPGAGIAIRIRGSNSIRSNNNPLFVVDGIPLSDEGTTPSTGGIVDGNASARNPLSFINPSDIESMSVLKDASATAIYGSRGANGVVIITTKSGRGSQGGTFEFSSNLSISTPANEFDLFNAAEYRAQNLALRGQPVPNFDDNTNSDTDWQDVITRSVASTDNNLSYAHNYGDGNIRATVSYAKQLGVLENSGQERLTGRINAAHRFFDNKLRVSIQTSISQVVDDAPNIAGGAGASGNLIGAAYAAPPTWPNQAGFSVDGNRLNPANILANFNAETVVDRILLNGSVEYDIVDALTAKVTLGYDQSDAAAVSVVSSAYNNSGRITGNGQASRNTLKATSNLLEATLNYKKDFENSSLDVIGGFTYQDFRRQGFNSQGFGIGTTDLNAMANELEDTANSVQDLVDGPFQNLGYNADGSSFVNTLAPLNDTNTIPGGGTRSYRSFWMDTFDNTDELQSFFGRINYSLNDKYLFTATIRADGSSRFGGNNQYGYFPSAAFAWKLSEEDFVGDTFSTLKLRLSGGIVGNQGGLGYANFLKRQRFAGPGFDNDGSVDRPGLTTVAVQNPDLKWEETLDFNVGFDFGFNNDRLRGSIDLYRKETSDLLFRQAAPAPAFDPFTFKNLEEGVVINQGVELALGYDLVQTEKSSFSVDFNIAYNDNVVEGLNGTTADFGAINGPGLTGAFAQRLGEGRSLFSYYMAEYSEDASGNPNFSADAKDFVDKDALPDITTGLSLNFSSGRFDASTYFAGQFGFYVYNNTANAFLNRPTFETSRNGTLESLELVSQEVSTLYLEKGDFVRLQNATIGYNVPLTGEGLFKSMRLSLNGQNLFLITGYSGLDPEVSTNTGDLGSGVPSAGIDYTSFPRPRTFTIGLNASF